MEANDNILVTKVWVTIMDEDGNMLEKGEGIRGKGNWWRITLQTYGKMINAEAWNLPKNVTKFVLK